MRSRFAIAGVVAVLLLSAPFTASATMIATNDPTVVNAFQSGATIVTFEGISGITAFNSQTSGADVPATAQLKNQVTGLTFFSNAFNGPAVLNLTGFGNFADAKSPPNVLSGTEPGGGVEDVICFTCFIEVTFTDPVSRVGAWNDPTGGNVRLFGTDRGGSTIFETVLGNQGQFIGVDTGINNIERALFLFISPASVNGFTIDDLSFARAGTTNGQVPLPATAALVALGLTALALGRRRRPAARD